MKNRSVLVIFLSLLSGIAHAQNKVMLSVLLTPAGSFTAASDKLSGSVMKNGNEFTADRLAITIESFKTGIDLRDKHFWKHLNSTQYTQAILSNLKGKNGKATADLEVNGVKKSVMMTYQDTGGQVKALMNLKASDFNLPPAKYLGVGVKDEVKGEIVVKYSVVTKSVPVKAMPSAAVKNVGVKTGAGSVKSKVRP